MRNLYLNVIAATLLSCFSITAYSAITYQPNGTSTFTGGSTYCQGTAAAPLVFTYTTCNAGAGFPITGGACMISWYTNTTNSTTLATATLVSGPTAFNSATAATGTQNYTPSTASAVSLYYFCVITLNSTGCAGTTGTTITSSSTQLVSVTSTPTTVTVTGAGAYCGSTTLNASNGGSGTIYYEGTTSNGTSTATPSTSQVISASGTYYFRAQSSSGCWSTQGSGAVTINTVPTVFVLSSGGSYCSGSTGVDITLSNSTVGVNYQLYIGSGTTGGPVAGTGTPPLNMGIQTTAGTYTVLATSTSAGACTANMSGTATVVMDPLPTVYTVTGGGEYCTGTTGLFIDLDHSDLGINYQLYNGTSTSGSPLAGANSSLSFGPETSAGTYTVQAMNASTGCTNNMSGSATINVLPAPTQYTMTGPATGGYCSGSAGADIGLNGSIIGTDYQLYAGTMAVGSPMLGTGTALNFGDQLILGTYSVLATVTTTGCPGGMANTISIVEYPLPNVYTISAGGSYCAGGAGIDLTLSGSDNNVNYQLYYGSSTVGGPLAGTGAAPFDLGVQMSGGTYTVMATNPVTTCTNNMSGTATITVNPLPATISGMTGICLNSSTTLTDASTGGTWTSNNTGIATIVSGTGYMTGVAVGNTTITYTLPTTCNITTTVTVNPLPIVAAITGTTNECVGFSNTLNDLSAGGVWSSTDGTIATIGSSSGTVNGINAGTVTVSYTVTNIYGCVTAATTPDTVNALPIVAAITGPTAVCVNATITLSDDTVGGAWTSGTVAVGTIDPSLGNLTGITAGNTNITYTVTSPAGCVTFVTTNETVNPLPVVGAILGPINVCAGLTMSLSDDTTGGVWSSNATSVATVDMTGIVTGVAFGTATISYTVTNGFGCPNSATEAVYIGNPMPSTVILPGASATLCHGNPANLVINTAGSGLTYQWLMNDTAIAGATNGSYIADTVGYYNVTLNNGTCTETIPGTTVITQPDPIISYNSTGNYLYTAGSYATYQWDLNSNPISGANSSILYLTGTDAGDYQVVVSDANGCFVASPAYDITGGGGGGTGVNNTTLSTAVNIYPNPATSVLRIDAPVSVNVSIMSPDGKTVITQKQAKNLDISELADGLYIITIFDENNTLLKTDKFIKIN